MKTYVKILLGVVLFVALAGIGVSIHLFRMQHKDLGKAKPDFVITAVDLQKAFEDNEAAATAKYVKKILEIEGEVESVKTGEKNILSVTIKTGSDLSSLICTFAAETDQAKFTAGSRVTVRGECSGFLMDVLMNDCVKIK
jgi:RecG-like helicase